MKSKIATIVLAGMMAVNAYITALAGIPSTNGLTQNADVFMAELERAIESSPILDISNYDVSITGKTARNIRSSNGQIVLRNVDEIVRFLEQQELDQKKFYESVETITENNKARAAGDVTKTIKYTRSLITKYVLSAKVKVNKNTGIISKVSSPKLTMTGGLGVKIEDQTYYTDIIDQKAAYVECEYTNVSEIKIPGVTDIEIQRKGYRTYMHYRYDTVYDTGNEAL
ncbi:hypothetical protein [Lacrimispora sphenoides]|uniref:Uncharacterized protein n=1 Tax=Lacrimispora sphenoides JCM 1415 TaxID=1297793 RepID=A0ABY1C2B3_9FIRM|nr:hypothetical protein [Lacrimispora sphenoides]SET56340.1 hypothetical protein SAMN02745906_0384 [[Clostridium] sphenoides JCM 1415]SUY49776.1 Uncharacterised protein [Lacrimispora sphenoides]